MRTNAKSLHQLYIMIQRAPNITELLAILDIPEHRLLIYREMHFQIVHHMQLMTEQNISTSLYDCFYTITDIVCVPYFCKLDSSYTNDIKKMTIKINYCFRELYRRQPFLALFRKQQNWYPYTFRGHAKRLAIINECIVECLDLMLWNQQLNQR